MFAGSIKFLLRLLDLVLVSFGVGVCGITHIYVLWSLWLHWYIIEHLWWHNSLVRHSGQTAPAHHLRIVVGRIHLVNLLLSRHLLL